VKKMDSTLLEQRPCPSCLNVIAGADLHRRCIECRGSDHAAANLGPLPACNVCRLIPRLSRRQRLEQFQERYVSPEEAEDPDLEVVDMEEHDEGVPFVFAMPADGTGPLVGERDDDDTSLSDTSGGRQEGPHHRSARDDYGGGACMATAAGRVMSLASRVTRFDRTDQEGPK